MLNSELRSKKNFEYELPLSHARFFFWQEFEMRSFKGSPSEMKGMNSLMALACFMFPWIIGVIETSQQYPFLLFKILVLKKFDFFKEELKS